MLSLLQAGLAAVDGRARVREALSRDPVRGRAWICAIGKAAESMTLGACDALGDGCLGGLLVTKPGHADHDRLARLGIEHLVGGHPVPTAESLSAGARLLETIGEPPADATRLFLISGGASSLVEVPVAPLGLTELQAMNRWLLASGLAIGDMNLARQSVSRIKGGGLLQFLGDRPARLLMISDVPGDDPRVIGSGLLTPELGLAEQAQRLRLPDWLADWVQQGLAERQAASAAGPRPELVARLADARHAAAEAAQHAGLTTHQQETLLEGDAAEAGRRLARRLLAGPQGLHIWGGETTIRLPEHPGRGGRNQHLALAAATVLAGRRDTLLLSAGTDGTDGPTEDAGALVDGGTLARGALDGLDAEDCLDRADSGTFLEASGDLIRIGPTGTNVMDLVMGLKLGACQRLPAP